MRIKKNIGTLDRSIRVILAIILFMSIGFVQNPILEWIFLIGSILLIFTAYTAWCGLYTLLGINTCKVK